MDIKFRVAGQKLMMLTKYNKFVSDAKDFMYLVFDLPREWAGYAVTAEFVQDGKIISKSLNQGNGVYLPNELSAGICLLALRGTNSGSVVTTDSIALYIDKYVGSDRSGGSGDSYITVELAAPTISVDQNGVVTATVDQEEGYVVKSSKQSSLRLPTHSGGSIVPEKNNKVAVQSGMYTTGDVIISGDKNLDPSNIRKGATIFNVSGEYEGSVGVDLPTINNPAYDEHVFADKEYINADGLKRAGSFTIDDELTEQGSLISQITSALRNKASNAGSAALPELGDTAAQPTDIAKGKVLYDDEGNPVVGIVSTVDSGTARGFSLKSIYCNKSNGIPVSIGVNGNVVTPTLFRQGSETLVSVPVDNFGDATPDKVAKGVTFTSKAGLAIPGTMEAASGGGLVVKKGNTSSPTIETGLSSIDYFVLMTTGFSRAGLMQLLYRKSNNAISYILCTSYSYSTMKTELNHANMTSSTLFTIDGGTVTWNGTGTSAFMSGESYMWLAFGA